MDFRIVQLTMSKDELAHRVVDQMFNNDPFSQWLGVERIKESDGHSVLRMKVRAEMLNGFGIAHGSITYALADSALAFASNSHGLKCLSIDTQISHLHPCKEGDVITAIANEITRSRKLGRYEVEIRNQDEKLVAHFRGTVFIKPEYWFPNERHLG